MQPANASAPPLGRSSRSTEVMTTCSQPHARHRLGEAHRLERVEGFGRAVGDRAVGAVPGADVAQDHEGGGLVLPALADVGAARLLADRVQAQLAHHGLDVRVVGAAGAFTLSQAGFRAGRGAGAREDRPARGEPSGSVGPAEPPLAYSPESRIVLCPRKASPAGGRGIHRLAALLDELLGRLLGGLRRSSPAPPSARGGCVYSAKVLASTAMSVIALPVPAARPRSPAGRPAGGTARRDGGRSRHTSGP